MPMTRVEHESTDAARATCPPDERTANNTRALDQSLPLDAASNDRPDIDVPMQLPTPPPQDALAHPPPPESHTKPESARIEAPARDIPTPMTVTDDSPEEQRASQTSPLSPTTAPSPTSLLASHLSSPFPSQRVCTLYLRPNMAIGLIKMTVHPQ